MIWIKRFLVSTCLLQWCAYAKTMNLTNEWQVVGDSDEIPRGAHVQFDVSSGLKYAKLLDPEDTVNSSSKDDSVNVIFDGTSDQGYVESSVQNSVIEVDDSSRHDSQTASGVIRKRTQINAKDEGGLMHFLEAVNSDQDLDESRMETIAELAHDIEYGPIIIQHSAEKLAELIGNTKLSINIRDYAARILGASLRNNPYAQNALFDQDTTFVASLVATLTKERHGALQSRILYALGSVLTDPRGKFQFLQINGLMPLRAILERGSNSEAIKNRVVTLLSDLLDTDNDSSYYTTELDYDLAKELQIWADLCVEALMAYGNDIPAASEDYAFNLLQLLTQIKKEGAQPDATKSAYNGHITVSGSFIQWLAKQAVKSRKQDSDYAKLVKEVRHKVFGNPLAARNHDDL